MNSGNIMLLKKIQYKLIKFLQNVFGRLGSLEISWGYLGFMLVSIVSILLLGANISRIIQKGYERYEIIQNEKRRLEKLIEKNAELKQDLKYYSSTEFIDIKAREELNMAFPNQRLVYIEKEEIDLSLEDTDKEVIEELSPSWRLWYDLIF